MEMMDILDYIYAQVNEKDLTEQQHVRIHVAYEMLTQVSSGLPSDPNLPKSTP